MPRPTASATPGARGLVGTVVFLAASLFVAMVGAAGSAHEAPVVPGAEPAEVRAIEAAPAARLAEPEPALEASPATPTSVATVIDATPAQPTEPVVVALRIVEPRPIPVTVGELYQALARSPWPRELWPQVVRIAQCEAHYGTGVDMVAEGDSGRALGVLQIRVDAHRELARDFNLLTIDGALGAAWIVYQRAGGSFSPWSCA